MRRSQNPHIARFARRCLTAALPLCCVLQPALSQLPTTARLKLVVNPPRSGVLGKPVILSVQGAAPSARYRYVATLTDTPNSVRPGPICTETTTLGSGPRVTWQPKSGTYRLTAYGPNSKIETDTLTLLYVVSAAPVMLNTSQTQAQSGKVTLVLRTSDLGPGHVYVWWMQYRGSGSTGGPNNSGPPPLSEPWIVQTSGPMATYPTPISPPSQIKATVAIHRGDPCEVIAAGAMPANH